MEETRLHAVAAKAALVQRPEEDDALTGAAASRRSRFWSSRSSGSGTVPPHRSAAAWSALIRASDSQSISLPMLFAMEGK